MNLSKYINDVFGVIEEVFLKALVQSPNAQGYIHGAISEELLKNKLESLDFEVRRIAEKPRGGFRAKTAEARGDFYIKKPKDKKWIVIESKGLKTNSEFSALRRSTLETKDKAFKFLKNHVEPGHKNNSTTYQRGLTSYKRAKEQWEKQNKGKFPPFTWDKRTPGPCSCVLNEIFNSIQELDKWIKQFSDSNFSEEKYRNLSAPIRILETHKPSTRKAPVTGHSQTGPLVEDFGLLAVDLFLRTKKHEFVFMNPRTISHSPASPEHLYQNYIIDILVKEKHEKPNIQHPWHSDIEKCIIKTKPRRQELDKSQLDKRQS